MKITNIKIKGSWSEVLNDSRFTVSKPPLDKEPSEKFKKSIIIAEHSPIRDLIIRVDFEDIPTWVATHLVRHKWEKFVQTQRTDRTGIDRHTLPQDVPVSMRCELNAQHLIDTSRKRLCYQASKETRELWEEFKYELHKIDPFIADVMVPNCVYRCGCPEGSNCCRMVEKWLPFAKIDLTNIQERYKMYNEWLYNKWKEKKGE